MTAQLLCPLCKRPGCDGGDACPGWIGPTYSSPGSSPAAVPDPVRPPGGNGDGFRQNAIPARIQSELAGIELCAPKWPAPVPLSQLGDGDAAVGWLWHGFLAREHTTLFSGLWKAGKTTLLAHLLRLCGIGGNLAGRIDPCKALVVSEESRGLWVRRRDDLGIGDHVAVLCRPFLTRPRYGEWLGFIDHLAGLVRSDAYKLVVFDTITSAWPVPDENDAAAVLSALTPLHALTAAGAAVLLVHHPRKGDAGEGQAARGSGALPGFVDIIVELRRYAPGDAEDRRRTLVTYSRFDESPPETVLQLTDGGYQTIGSKIDAKAGDRWAVVADILPGDGLGLTAEDIRAAWPEGGIPKPGLRTIRNDLSVWQQQGRVAVSGAGSKGDPHRFRLGNSIPASPYSYSAGIESGDNGRPDAAAAAAIATSGDRPRPPTPIRWRASR